MAAAPTNASLPHIHGLFTVWIVRVEIHKPPRIISHRLGSADHSRPQKQLCSVVEVSGHVGVIDFIGLGKDKYRGRPDVYLEISRTTSPSIVSFAMPSHGGLIWVE